MVEDAAAGLLPDPIPYGTSDGSGHGSVGRMVRMC